MHLEESVVDKCVCAVGYLLSECVRYQVNSFDFVERIEDAQLGADLNAVLCKYYEQIVCIGCMIEDRFCD